jgi:hypothetical protein
MTFEHLEALPSMRLSSSGTLRNNAWKSAFRFSDASGKPVTELTVRSMVADEEFVEFILAVRCDLVVVRGVVIDVDGGAGAADVASASNGWVEFWSRGDSAGKSSDPLLLPIVVLPSVPEEADFAGVPAKMDAPGCDVFDVARPSLTDGLSEIVMADGRLFPAAYSLSADN